MDVCLSLFLSHSVFISFSHFSLSLSLSLSLFRHQTNFLFLSFSHTLLPVKNYKHILRYQYKPVPIWCVEADGRPSFSASSFYYITRSRKTEPPRSWLVYTQLSWRHLRRRMSHAYENCTDRGKGMCNL